MNTLLWTLVASALCIVYTEGACEDDCWLRGGKCDWNQPGLDYQAIGNCSEGVPGVGTFCQCGTCWKQVSQDVPCCKKCEGQGGICSTKLPRDGFQEIDKCVGMSGGIETYCGSCWKNQLDEVPCNEACEGQGGMCSTKLPRDGFQKIDKCVGMYGGIETYCGSCWKKNTCRMSRMCARVGGQCSPTSPGKGWTANGICETKDCICWVNFLMQTASIDLEEATEQTTQATEQALKQ